MTEEVKSPLSPKSPSSSSNTVLEQMNSCRSYLYSLSAKEVKDLCAKRNVFPEAGMQISQDSLMNLLKEARPWWSYWKISSWFSNAKRDFEQAEACVELLYTVLGGNDGFYQKLNALLIGQNAQKLSANIKYYAKHMADFFQPGGCLELVHGKYADRAQQQINKYQSEVNQVLAQLDLSDIDDPENLAHELNIRFNLADHVDLEAKGDRSSFRMTDLSDQPLISASSIVQADKDALIAALEKKHNIGYTGRGYTFFGKYIKHEDIATQKARKLISGLRKSDIDTADLKKRARDYFAHATLSESSESAMRERLVHIVEGGSKPTWLIGHEQLKAITTYDVINSTAWKMKRVLDNHADAYYRSYEHSAQGQSRSLVARYQAIAQHKAQSMVAIESVTDRALAQGKRVPEEVNNALKWLGGEINALGLEPRVAEFLLAIGDYLIHSIYGDKRQDAHKYESAKRAFKRVLEAVQDGPGAAINFADFQVLKHVGRSNRYYHVFSQLGRLGAYTVQQQLDSHSISKINYMMNHLDAWLETKVTPDSVSEPENKQAPQNDFVAKVFPFVLNKAKYVVNHDVDQDRLFIISARIFDQQSSAPFDMVYAHGLISWYLEQRPSKEDAAVWKRRISVETADQLTALAKLTSRIYRNGGIPSNEEQEELNACINSIRDARFKRPSLKRLLDVLSSVLSVPERASVCDNGSLLDGSGKHVGQRSENEALVSASAAVSLDQDILPDVQKKAKNIVNHSVSAELLRSKLTDFYHKKQKDTPAAAIKAYGLVQWYLEVRPEKNGRSLLGRKTSSEAACQLRRLSAWLEEAYTKDSSDTDRDNLGNILSSLDQLKNERDSLERLVKELQSLLVQEMLSPVVVTHSSFWQKESSQRTSWVSGVSTSGRRSLGGEGRRH